MKRYLPLLIVVVLTTVVMGCLNTKPADQAPNDDGLRLNEIQIIGSHNSYKEAIEPDLMSLLLQSDPKMIGLDYHHPPISDQLELGLRSLELDVLHDPYGGQYTRPKGLELLADNGLAPAAYDTTDMTQPGLKTLHVPDIDFRSSCMTFKSCLTEIKQWSIANQNHIPIIITINPKNSGVSRPGFTEVIAFDESAWRSFDQELLDVLGPDALLTPAMVKGDYPTLNESITKGGWPALGKVRGKVMFVLDAGETNTQQYLNANKYDRPMFVNVGRDHDHCAFLIKNDPIKMKEEIVELVQQGFIVRTRADANTTEARNGDTRRFVAAQQSGAQVISTDYYLRSLSPNEDFEIIFEDRAYERCNPILSKNAKCDLK